MTAELAIPKYISHVSLCKENLSDSRNEHRYIRVIIIICMHTTTHKTSISVNRMAENLSPITILNNAGCLEASRMIVIRAIDNGNEVKVYEPEDRRTHTLTHAYKRCHSAFNFKHENLSDNDGSINLYKHHECWQYAILLIDASDDNLSITLCHLFLLFSTWHWAFHYFCISNLEFRVWTNSAISEYISSMMPFLLQYMQIAFSDFCK